MSNYTEGSLAVEHDGRESITVWGDKWESKQKIERLFEKRKELDYWDILQSLGLDLEFIVEICEELEEEGKIEGIE